MSQLTIHTPILTLNGVGKNKENIFAKKGIFTILDLINYIPRRYRDTRKIYDIKSIYELFNQVSINNAANLIIRKAVKGRIISIQQIRTIKKHISLVDILVEDLNNKNYNMSIKYFNLPYISKVLQQGETYVFWGRIKLINNKPTLYNPEFEKFSNSLQKFGKITPIYPQSKNITQTLIRKLLYQTIPIIQKQVNEPIPKNILQTLKMLSLSNAYIQIHFPKSISNLKKAYKRLAIQELLEILDTRPNLQQTKKGLFQLRPQIYNQILTQIKKISKGIPYKLTDSQEKALTQIIDYYNAENRNIFLYGDVGAGKTLIFIILSLALLANNASSILIAPTTVLADQHFKSLKNIARIFKQPRQILLVTSQTKKHEIEKLDFTKPYILVTTQSIFFRERMVNLLKNLALVAIDEEQRFGTNQRLHLIKNKAKIAPYYLALSATPIPQTLAHAFYGYTKTIYLKERPFNTNIETHIIHINKLDQLFNWLKQELAKKKQAFVIFPRINSTNDTLALEDFIEPFTNLLKPYKIAVVHGKTKNKEQILRDFSNNKISVILSTNLIEVGIDAPNASIIIIFGAEQFGLAQLHQLRGRVGRRGQQSYCLLIPSLNIKDSSLTRLQKFSQIYEGIKLAELDLKIRGPGAIFNGPEQTGFNKLKIANINDFNLMHQSLELYKKLQELNIPIARYIYYKNKGIT